MHCGTVPPIATSSLRSFGFTLLELAIVITIISVMTGVSIVAGLGMMESAKRTQTANKLDMIEQALMAYRLTYNRLPCPGDATLTPGNANYGVEGATPGACTGGTPAANHGPYKSVVEGAVPFKALSLPEEFMYDGWGRKFAYVVDERVTGLDAFISMKVSDSCSLKVKDAAGSYRTTGAIYALVSFGPDGHGGYDRNGNRVSAGSTNADEQQNCHCNVVAAAGTFDNVFVEKDATANSATATDTFDDVVRFKERWQMQSGDDYALGDSLCSVGFRIDGSAGQGRGFGSTAAVGDVNGDGIPDLVISEGSGQKLWVIFGKQNGWPIPPDGLPVDSLTGSDGFAIVGTSGYGLLYPAVGDVNHDGYDDIVFCDWNDCYIVFGGPGAWPASVSLANLAGSTGVNGTNGTKLSYTTPDASFLATVLGASSTGAAAAVGDINGDGVPDIAAVGHTYASNAPGGFVLMGHTNPWPATVSINAQLDGRHAFEIVTSDANYDFGLGGGIGVGDVTGDGKAEIVFDGYHSFGGVGSAYVIYGSAAVYPVSFDIATEITGATGRATRFYSNCCWDSYFGTGSMGPSLADLNDNAVKDLVLGTQYTNRYVVFGKALGWPATVEMGAYIDGSATGFLLESTKWTPAWASGFGNDSAVADINGDGRPDLLYTCNYCAPVGTAANGAGAVLVYFTPPGGWQGMTPSSSTANWPASDVRFDETLDGTNGFRVEGANAGDSVLFVKAADFTNHGKTDLIVGAPGYHGNDGAVYVYFGKSGWPPEVNLSVLN
jgi:prepilin-type N-terminal cleavage/methylation domain-containing protein